VKYQLDTTTLLHQVGISHYFMMKMHGQTTLKFLNCILAKNSTCFGQIYCPSSGVLILYSQQQVFVIQVMLTVC